MTWYEQMYNDRYAVFIIGPILFIIWLVAFMQSKKIKEELNAKGDKFTKDISFDSEDYFMTEKEIVDLMRVKKEVNGAFVVRDFERNVYLIGANKKAMMKAYEIIRKEKAKDGTVDINRFRVRFFDLESSPYKTLDKLKAYCKDNYGKKRE